MLNDVLDRQVEVSEEKFRSLLEQSLASFLERSVPVKCIGTQAFDFKELRGTLSGEVVLVSVTATEGGPGRMQFALSRTSAGVLADLLLMGDGLAEFSYEEHLDPLRDMFKEVAASFAADLSKELGHRVAFEDVKANLVDLTPSDFVGTNWIMSQLHIGLDAPQTIFHLVSTDFYTACYPDTGGEVESSDGIEEPEDLKVTQEMGLVLDIELPISIELGRTTMLIRDIIRLAPGSVVELDKLSGEPVDLFVNNRLFARGEVVVVDENFAVRLTELVAPSEIARGRAN